MSKQFVHIKEALIAKGLSELSIAPYKYQSSDCSVKALAIVKNIPYQDALGYARDSFKRQPNKGVTLTNITKGFLQDDSITTLNGREIKTYYNNQGKMVERSMTVGTFAKTYNKGKYFVVVRKHALAIVDGVIIDNNEGLRRPVQKAWRAIED